jgi:hypothetical protein
MTTTTDPDPAQLSGWGLTKRICEVLGWREIRRTLTGREGLRTPECYFPTPLPAYHESLDACERDLLPVLGGLDFSLWRAGDTWHAAFNLDQCVWDAEAGGSAEAVCKAWLLAMEDDPDASP